jgi:hypothetical protein
MIKIGKPALLVVVLAFFLSSCDFFTTSWGSGAKRDPSKVQVNAGNVDDLIAAAKGDEKLSKELLSKIKDKINDPNISASEKVKLQKAAVTAATQASGVSTLVVSNVGKIIDGANDTDSLKNLLSDIQDQAKKNDIKSISGDLTTVLSQSVTTGSKGEPVFSNSLGKDMSENDLTMLVVIVALGQEKSVENYLDEWGSGGKDINDANSLSTDNEKVAVAAINAMIQYHSESDLTKMLKDALNQ